MLRAFACVVFMLGVASVVACGSDDAGGDGTAGNGAAGDAASGAGATTGSSASGSGGFASGSGGRDGGSSFSSTSSTSSSTSSTASSTGSGGAEGGGGETLGEMHSGDYHIGPVDFEETEWTNACSGYPPELREITGPYLAGVDVSLGGDGSLCDVCAQITTRLGAEVIVRIITYGQSGSAGDMDLSVEAYESIYEEDPQGTPQDPRPMTWQLVACSDNGTNIYLHFQTGAHEYWSSFWVRNGRLPIDKVEVRSQNHADFVELERTPDGPFTDASGFGSGEFELRITGRDGRVLSQSFPGFEPGELIETEMQFD